MPNKEPVIISACLVGVNCRYDGQDAYSKEAAEIEGALLIPICPEQLGGLSTPRLRAEITEGDGTEVLSGKARVLDSEGTDITKRFKLGAEEVLKITRLTGAKKALLKEKSPSCGVTIIKKDGEKIKGMGVLAALLKREGIEIVGF
ncbi:MAG: DUF523 domain-containing protein [Thermodesulfobacteriota bacterium]